MKYVVAVGTAWDGMDLHGTFDTHEEATNHAMARHQGEAWAVVGVFPIPTKPESQAKIVGEELKKQSWPFGA
jgi:hypothetical protein